MYSIMKKKYISKQIIKVISLTCLTLFILSSWGIAAEYYIDGSRGNDGNAGTLSNPWKTIGKANNTVSGGDTVYIRAGNYNQTINPSKNGWNGNYITYKNYSGEEVVISNVYNGADVTNSSYIIIDGITFNSCSNAWVWGRNSSGSTSDHIIVRNCNGWFADGWGGINFQFCSYITLDNNYLEAHCPCTSTCTSGGPGDTVIFDGASYCLVENNTIINGTHYGLQFRTDDGPSHHNIIQNNVFDNAWHSNVGMYGNVNYSVVSNNIIRNGGVELGGYCSPSAFERSAHRAIQHASSYCIIRNNKMHDNGSFLVSGYEGFSANYNRIYNNTSYRDHIGLFFAAGTSTPTGNIVKNNIYSWNVNSGFRGSSTSSSQAINNAYYQSSFNLGSMSGGGNINANPLFKDAPNEDFTLSSSSPLIDAGAWLTTVTSSSGSGTTLNVADASYFHDGFGITTGDTIQIEGHPATAIITDISGNTITVNSSLSWSKGNGVSLPYSGSAPDIGAEEATDGSENQALYPPVNLRVLGN